MTISPLSPDRFDDAARLLAAAFENDPLHRAAFGVDVRARSEQFYRARVATGLGAWFGGYRDARLIGVAHWEDGHGSTRAALLADAQVASPGRWVDRVAATVFRWVLAGRDPAAPPDPAGEDGPRVLGPLAVWPSEQGRGVGAELMRRFCAELDQQRRAGYLETAQASNVAFYERFGFAATGEMQLPGFVCWAMTRPAASRARGTPAADARSLRG